MVTDEHVERGDRQHRQQHAEQAYHLEQGLVSPAAVLGLVSLIATPDLHGLEW
ncbi:hypothetical protein Apa02nite_030480 [Actinoplanes palleronii]|uniref:Uncharacterized protein n=1 Tax=Actinoplanes palleronii TaxID=113570 RepID=A0ABQ4B9L4_9ACTN|nr:hypothetical protein Apa02nite_030480 [Actinoplanes palleronii]